MLKKDTSNTIFGVELTRELDEKAIKRGKLDPTNDMYDIAKMFVEYGFGNINAKVGFLITAQEYAPKDVLVGLGMALEISEHATQMSLGNQDAFQKQLLEAISLIKDLKDDEPTQKIKLPSPKSKATH